MSEIVIDGIKCRYLKYGEKGKTVVLLHGWGQNIEMMDYIGQFLRSHFVVYNLDFPGFGQSEEPPRAFSVEDYSEWLKHFLDAFKVEDPIFIAHSFGCRVAVRYAYKYPVHRMVLTGAAGIRDKRGVDYYAKVYSYKLAKNVLLHSPFKNKLTALQNRSGSADYRNASGVMRETFVKVVNDDVSDILKDINVETLLVFGENDTATPLEKGRLMEKLMPDAALVVFENDDHYAYFHQPDRFNAVLDAFLKRDYL